MTEFFEILYSTTFKNFDAVFFIWQLNKETLSEAPTAPMGEAMFEATLEKLKRQRIGSS